MSRFICCKWRSLAFLLILPATLLVLAAPVRAEGYWYDAAGVEADSMGYAITGLPDINGDGFDEFLVGSPGYDFAGQGAGRVSLWYGGSEPAGRPVTLAPDSTWTGSAPEKFGWAVAGIGDVNRDGFDDWAVGAPNSNVGGTARGRVYVFFGADRKTGPFLAPMVIPGGAGLDHFGFSVAPAGDFDGDGADDFIVGAPFANLGKGRSGAAYIIYGKTGGPSNDLADATVLGGEVSGDNFGWSVAAVGNFLGGSQDCVAVGAPLSDSHGGANAGAVYVFAGGGAADDVADFVTGPSGSAAPNSWFGYDLQGGMHLDSDSITDLAVGAPLSNEAASEAGRVELYYGGSLPAKAADHFINGQTGGDHFGWSLDGVGNVIGSGADDLLIGAPNYRTNEGRAYLYAGGSNADAAASLTRIDNDPVNTGTAPDDQFGWDVAAAGDFDGDGQPDYAISAPGGNNGGTNAQSGFVRLEHSSAGPVPTLLRNWRAVWRAPRLVDLAFALSLPDEEIVSISLVRRVEGRAGSAPQEEQLWQGPALPIDAGVAGSLVRRGEGFGYLDDLSGLLAAGTTVSYRLAAVGSGGTEVSLDELAGPGAPPVVGVVNLALSAAWPNPANPRVNIRYRAPLGERAVVRIVDLRGHAVRTLPPLAGTGNWQTLAWDGTSDSGRSAPSGVYLIRLESGGQLRTERVTLAR